MNTKRLLCFIDDAADERELFDQVFGIPEAVFRVVTAETFEEAKGLIETIGEVPALFVLDLYFASGKVAPKAIPASGPISLPDDEGDLIKAFLNVEIAQQRYRSIRDAYGQSAAGGLELIAQVRQHFPTVPIVTYTRKGTPDEAEQARRAGARRVLQKPSGIDWIATTELTVRLRPQLEAAFLAALVHDSYEILNLIVHYAGLFLGADEARNLGQMCQNFRVKLLQDPANRLERDEVYQLMELSSHPFIRALIFLLLP